MPTFIVISEYDNPDLDTQGALCCWRLMRKEPRMSALHAYGVAQSSFDGLPVQYC